MSKVHTTTSRTDARQVLILCSGGLEERSGGVGRLMRYLIDAWATQDNAPAYRIIDARGPRHILWSPFYLLRALTEIAWQTARGRVRLLHVNISVRGSAIRKAFVVALAALLRIPVVLHLHDGHFTSYYDGLSPPARRMLRRLFRYATAVIVLGERWRDMVVRELNVPPESVVVLYNAVPDPAVQRSPQQKRGDCRILFLGRLGTWKGVPELLTALSSKTVRASAWHATLAGDGDVESFRSRVADLGLAKRINLPGWVSGKTAQQLLQQADILVLPSHGEGMPMSVIEALAHEVAVVTTPVGAIPELVRDGESAAFVPIDDPIALALTLQGLIQDPTRRHRIAHAGRQVFEQKLDVAVFAQRLTALYDDVTRHTDKRHAPAGAAGSQRQTS